MSRLAKTNFFKNYKYQFQLLRRNMIRSGKYTQTDMNFYLNCELDAYTRQVNSDVLHSIMTEKEGQELKTQMENYTAKYCI